MIAFHGDKKIKEEYLARVRAHRAADQLIKGTYWEEGRGCAVGCTIHSGDHKNYETELGIPRILARLEDGIFEQLPNDKAIEWPEKFLEAIPVGADLSMVWPEFAVWLLIDPEHGVIKFGRYESRTYEENERTKKLIQAVADLYKRKISGERIDLSEWLAANRSAAATAYVASAAAYAAIATYADDSADAASAAAASAASASAASAAARIKQSEKLLELFSKAPVVG